MRISYRKATRKILFYELSMRSQRTWTGPFLIKLFITVRNSCYQCYNKEVVIIVDSRREDQKIHNLSAGQNLVYGKEQSNFDEISVI